MQPIVQNHTLDPNVAVYIRDQLREARAIALGDAESFHEILFAVERFGSLLTKNSIGTLGNYKYRESINAVAEHSPLAEDIPNVFRQCHMPFSILYRSVNAARNDALHQGAFARHLTNHAIQLSLVLEDALMQGAVTVGDYMVRGPVCAALWQPISYIRQAMLINSFSYLPVLWVGDQQQATWYLISDYTIAQYVRHADRNVRLAKTLEDVIAAGDIIPSDVHVCTADISIEEALALSDGKPILVHQKSNKHELIGIVAPFDLL